MATFLFVNIESGPGSRRGKQRRDASALGRNR
ncbi:Uncharacterised protein [Yersinia frederiksenii]|jgi:hypothetical protein|uniref:Uncharacterized protein n=1 Tax=Yersinia frederiksenii TaxID=29484 RepID=A0AAI8ZU56_YERFR|nr:Uncharacterised protein [Yersinia frederiksenii]CFR19223.1 Uncharacterised protein [Yersinia frederiksenii]CNG71960.1 Uncharacterised protein [Yersinia frederiksenii]CQH47401.1 Uncharacterised protein [Yersinia frederiksenii]CQI98859.1 Uncharacterised protein [Yersinia frederiksenii]